MSTTHRAGFIHIVGRPNVGKSTLINKLINYPLSIVTHKPQTTRHNIIGIDQSRHHQAIYVDTPGYIKPNYTLQKAMMQNVHRALTDGDILLWMVDIRHTDHEDTFLKKHLSATQIPVLLLLNKIDLIPTTSINNYIAKWQAKVPITTQLIPTSAIHDKDVAQIAQKVTALLPIHPPYYDKETLTDKPIDFFIADILRKAIFLHYKQEIPYSTEVTIERFIESKHNALIDVTIHVERKTQKAILIGKQGQALKKMGTSARKALETFLQKSIFLTQHIKVLPDWRHKRDILAKFGY